MNKRKPKLICKTPVLTKHYGTWMGDDQRDWLCGSVLAKWFTIPDKAHISAAIYDRRPPGGDALRVRVALVPGEYGHDICTRWNTGSTAPPSAVARWSNLYRRLCEVATESLKAAGVRLGGKPREVWLEIELED